MPTVVHTNTTDPNPQTSSAFAVGLGIVLAVILGVLFFMFALPSIRDASRPQGIQTEVNAPTPEDSGALQNPVQPQPQTSP